jgi:peptide/nickel transport system permease protein
MSIKLRSDKRFMTGLVIIGFACIVALFGYLIAPDNTTQANRMVLEAGSKDPGYRQLFLKIKKEGNIKEHIGQVLWRGKTEEYEWIPIVSCRRIADKLQVEKYIDEGVTETVIYPIGRNSLSGMIEEKTYWFGTDKFGRDILSRIIIGTRVALGVGAIAVLVSLSLGIFLGAVAGYKGGKTDRLIMWFIQVVWSIPAILLVLGVVMLLGKGFWQVFLAIGLSLWVNVARLVRGQVLSVKEQPYVEAARLMGFSHFRILFVHILPNIMGAVWVMAAANFATAIMLEAGLSFLGIGIQAPQPSWGLMMKENYNFIVTNHPMLAIIPGAAIMLMVLAFHLLGNGLRDWLDVRAH